MMENKYQLVAWTKNITDKKRARLYEIPSVELELEGPLIKEVGRCVKLLEKADWHLSYELARRFVLAYERSARVCIFTGHFDDAIRYFLRAADYCIHEDYFNWAYYDSDLGHYSHFCGKLRHEFVRLCEEAISLARTQGLEHVLNETDPGQTMELYLEHTQEDRDIQTHVKRMSVW